MHIMLIITLYESRTPHTRSLLHRYNILHHVYVYYLILLLLSVHDHDAFSLNSVSVFKGLEVITLLVRITAVLSLYI